MEISIPSLTAPPWATKKETSSPRFSVVTLEPPLVIEPEVLPVAIPQPPRIFNGTITIQNKKTNEHRTFKITTQAPDARFAPGKRIIGLLSGPDNTSDYQSFGFVNDEYGVCVWTKKQGFTGKPSAFDSYVDMVNVMLGGFQSRLGREHLYSGYTVLLMGTCLVCNRPLTDPESIRIGIGPVCRGDV